MRRRPPLIARNARINLERPAIDAAGQGLRRLYALCAQPRRHFQAALPVMAIADHVQVDIELLQVRGDGPHGNELRAFNPACLVFPRFSNIDQQQRFALFLFLLQLGNADFQFAHPSIVSRSAAGELCLPLLKERVDTFE